MYSMNRKSAYINIPYINMYNVFIFNSCSFKSGNKVQFCWTEKRCLMGWINRKHKETKCQYEKCFIFNSCSFNLGNSFRLIELKFQDVFRSIQTHGMSLWQRHRKDKNGHPLVFIVIDKGTFTLNESECETENFLWSLTLFYIDSTRIPKVKIVKNDLSASLHIHNAQTKGTQYKSMVNAALKREDYTSWSLHSIVIF